MADMVVHGSSGAEVGLPTMASPRENNRREALADDPTPEYLKGALLQHSADEIRPGLYLSGMEAGMMYGELKRHGITHILVVTASAEMRYPEDFIYKRLPVYDSKEEDLLSNFESAIEFINKGRTTGAVLVHCMAGVSRSATVVTAWLMKEEQMDAEKALRKVKKKRVIVNPNEGFLWQLHQWEAMGYKLDGSTSAHKQLRKWKKSTEEVRRKQRERVALLQSTMQQGRDNAASRPTSEDEKSCLLQ